MLLTRRLSTALRRSAAFPRHLSTEPPAIVSGKEYRKGHQINISGVTPEEVSLFDPFQTFEETPFCKEIRSVLLNESYISPTPTQAQSWPIALHGRDMISVAKTGSGKTCGFLLPAIHKILVGPGSSSPAVTGQKPKRRVRLGGVPKLLVLAPTRELCLQINAEAEKYSRSCRLTSVSCYGGASRSFQVAALSKGADIVIGTPGRINDLLEAGVLDVSQISTLVLDEADRMLDMGFEPQIKSIIGDLPEERQNLFFSATWPLAVKRISESYLRNPIHLEIGDQNQLNANKDIKQSIIVTSPREKIELMLEYLDTIHTANSNKMPRVLIFCNQKAECESIVSELKQSGYSADAIHGDKSQSARENVLHNFRSGRTPLLVATDIAARGLDVKDINTVINFAFPLCIEDYVHRIGRTARGGTSGNSISFLTRRDSSVASELVALLKRCDQEVPPELQAMVASSRHSYRPNPWTQGSSSGGSGGRFSSTISRFGERYGRSSSGGFDSPRDSRFGDVTSRFRSSRFGDDSAPRSSRFGDSAPRYSRFGDDSAPPRSSRFGDDSAPPRSSRFGDDSAPRSSRFGDDSAPPRSSRFGDDSAPRSSRFTSESFGSRFGSSAPSSSFSTSRFSSRGSADSKPSKVHEDDDW